jgi:tetratricopeptide (TPR) repeat protein
MLTKDIVYLNRAIDNVEGALELDNQVCYWDSFSMLLQTRFENTGSVEDLDHAIEYSERCVMSKGGLDIWTQALVRRSLGIALQRRHSLKSSVESLNRAVHLHREAVQLLEPFKRFDAIKSRGEQSYRDFKRLASYPFSLMVALGDRFHCTAVKKDADEAIRLGDALVLAGAKFPTSRSSIVSGIKLGTGVLRFQTMFNAETWAEKWKRLFRGSKSKPEESLEYPQSLVIPTHELPHTTPTPPGRLLAQVKLKEQHSGNKQAPPAVQAERLFVEGSLSMVSWWQSGDLTELDTAIIKHEQGLELITDTHPHQYIALARLLKLRYFRTHSLEDHERAVYYGEGALKLTSGKDPAYSECLVLLGSALRFSSQSDQVDRAIKLLERSLEMTLEESPQHEECVFHLSSALCTHFYKSGERASIDRSIELERVIIPILAKTGSKELVRNLHALSFALMLRHQSYGARKDIDDAIEITTEAMKLPAHTIYDEASLLRRLGECYQARHHSTRTVEDLDEAIEMFGTALSKVPSPDLHRPYIYGRLIRGWTEKFFHTGATEDLDQALQYFNEGLSDSGGDAEDLDFVLYGGLEAMRERDKFFGSTHDPIRILGGEQSVIHAPDTYQRVFQEMVDMHDFAAEIRENQNSQYFSPLEFFPRFRSVHHESSERKDERKQSITGGPSKYKSYFDLHESSRSLLSSIRPQLRVLNDVTVVSAPGPKEAAILLHIAKELDEEINRWRQGMETNEQDSFRHAYMLQLISMVRIRFTLTRSTDDLNEVIAYGEKSLEFTPSGHAKRGLSLQTLSQDYINRFQMTGSQSKDLIRAIELKEEASNMEALPPRHRFIHAAVAAELCLEKQPRELDRAKRLLNLAAGLMPRISQWHLNHKELQGNVRLVGKVISKAVSLALESGEEVIECLRLLETGRGVISGMHVDITSELARLPDCELTNRFAELQNVLGSPFSDSLPLELSCSAAGRSDHSHFHPDAVMEIRRKCAAEFSDILTRIRSFSGFENFCRGPSESEMKSLASPGAIVLLNVSNIRSDAFIITSEKVYSIKLETMSYQDVATHATQLLQAVNLNNKKASEAVHNTLKWLWDVAVGPVLEELGFIKTPEGSEQWPRIWWVCCGLLSLFPIHAAGHHTDGSDRTALDRVVSSYAVTLKTLSRSRDLVIHEPERIQRVQLVGMSKTPKQRELVWVEEVMVQLAKLMKSAGHPLLNPRKKRFLEALKDVELLHLICHGAVNRQDPSESLFLLEDWETDPLTVSVLASSETKKPQFAFLSTCYSASAQEDSLLDESLHLSLAVQLAGFPSVVGTLWEVNELAAVEVAEKIYEMMMEEGVVNNTKGAVALHAAVWMSV